MSTRSEIMIKDYGIADGKKMERTIKIISSLYTMSISECNFLIYYISLYACFIEREILPFFVSISITFTFTYIKETIVI